jgi:hypothetical protein
LHVGAAAACGGVGRSGTPGPLGGSDVPLFQMLACVLCLVFATLAVLHLYWAVGGQLGLPGAVPTVGDRPVFEPGALFAIVIAAFLVAAAMLTAQRGGLLLLGLPERLARLGTWGLAFVFAVRAIGEFRYVGFFKRVRGTLFARRDSLVYSPLCVVISALAAGLAILAP